MTEPRTTSIGPFVKFTDPGIVEILAMAGFTHVVIDMEHGPVSYERAQDLVRAGERHGILPLVRVSSNRSDLILKALDIGAAGVHVPHITTPEDAQRVVDACFFHPTGERGLCRYVRASGYTDLDGPAHMKRANENVFCVLHIEGKAGIERLSDILDVEGIGVIFLGPYDLSQSCGVPGEVQHPDVVALMEKACKMANERGVAVGTYVHDATDCAFWRERGVTYVCLGVDTGIMMDACKAFVQSAQGGGN